MAFVGTYNPCGLETQGSICGPYGFFFSPTALLTEGMIYGYGDIWFNQDPGIIQSVSWTDVDATIIQNVTWDPCDCEGMCS